jgi:hypothetical protein
VFKYSIFTRFFQKKRRTTVRLYDKIKFLSATISPTSSGTAAAKAATAKATEAATTESSSSAKRAAATFKVAPFATGAAAHLVG